MSWGEKKLLICHGSDRILFLVKVPFICQWLHSCSRRQTSCWIKRLFLLVLGFSFILKISKFTKKVSLQKRRRNGLACLTSFGISNGKQRKAEMPNLRTKMITRCSWLKQYATLYMTTKCVTRPLFMHVWRQTSYCVGVKCSEMTAGRSISVWHKSILLSSAMTSDDMTTHAVAPDRHTTKTEHAAD